MEATKKKRRDVDDFIADARAKQERKSWRDVIKVHPAADLFPMMSEQELRELGEDIKKHGLRHPISITTISDYGTQEIWQDAASYVLLDGRNRLDAMELAGIPFTLSFCKSNMRSRSSSKHWWMVLNVSDPGDTEWDPVARYQLHDGRWIVGDVDMPVISDPYDYVLSLNVHRRHL